MLDSIGSSSAVGIAGPIGAGKTTLAKKLCARLDGRVISFGSYVRSEAMSRGIPTERSSLQNLGEMLIRELGPTVFLGRVLASNRIDRPGVLVFDGIRHLIVWRAILDKVKRGLLVYLDVPEDERIRRIMDRDAGDIVVLRETLSHPMEKNATDLRFDADIVLTDVSDDLVDKQILSRLRSASM